MRGQAQQGAGNGDAAGGGRLLLHTEQRIGAAHDRLRHIGKRQCAERGELHRARHAGNDQQREDQCVRRLRRQQGATEDRYNCDAGVDEHDAAEADVADEPGRRRLHAEIADEDAEHKRTGRHRVETEAELEQQRQQERQRRQAPAEETAAAHRQAERQRAECSERNHRMVDSQRAPHRHDTTAKTESKQRQRHNDRYAAASDQFDAGQDTEDRGAGEEKAGSIEPAALNNRRGRHDAPDEHQSDEAERHVDVENPVPRKIDRDEAAERRTQQRRAQRQKR